MVKRTNIFFGVCLFLITTMQLMGGAFILEWRLGELQEKQDKKIYQEGRELQNITLSRIDYMEAKTRDHEIRWQNRMYDVACIVFKSDSVQLYFISDELEDDLLERMESFFSIRHSQTTGGLSFVWIKIALLPYLAPTPESMGLRDDGVELPYSFPFIPFSWSKPDLAAKLPPPRSTRAVV